VEGRRQRDEGNPNFSEGESKPEEGKSKSGGTKSNSNPWISFAESSLINDLRRPPGHFVTPKPSVSGEGLDEVGRVCGEGLEDV
jgi:hypothetical protein